MIKARIDPAPRYMVQVVEIEGKVCVDLEVQNGPAYPYYYAADGVRVAYVRHGDQSVEATARELNELILKGMNQTFDALPSPYRVGDVSFTLLAATCWRRPSKTSGTRSSTSPRNCHRPGW